MIVRVEDRLGSLVHHHSCGFASRHPDVSPSTSRPAGPPPLAAGAGASYWYGNGASLAAAQRQMSGGSFPGRDDGNA
jgi:hypothetical protein